MLGWHADVATGTFLNLIKPEKTDSSLTLSGAKRLLAVLNYVYVSSHPKSDESCARAIAPKSIFLLKQVKWDIQPAQGELLIRLHV